MVQGITNQAIVPLYYGSESNPNQLFATRLQEFCYEIDVLFEKNRNVSSEAKVRLEDMQSDMLALIIEINSGTILTERQIQEFISFSNNTIRQFREAFEQSTHSREAKASVKLIQYPASAQVPMLTSTEDAHITKIYGIFKERIDFLRRKHQAEMELQRNGFSDVLNQVSRTFEGTILQQGNLSLKLGERICQLETTKEAAETRSTNQEAEIATLHGRVSVLSNELAQREISLVETATRIEELEGQIGFMLSEAEANEIAHKTVLETLKNDHQEQINKLTGSAKAAKIALQEAIDKLESRHQEQINKLVEDAEAAGIFHLNALDELESNHQKQINTLKADAQKTDIHLVALEKLTSSHQTEINMLKADAEAADLAFQEALDALESNHKKQLSALRADAEVTDNQLAALDKLTSGHQKQIDMLRADAEVTRIDYQKTIDALESSHQKQINMLKADVEKTEIHLVALEKLTAIHQRQINMLKADAKAAGIAHQEALNELASNHQKQIDTLKANTEAAVISLQNALDELKSSHQMQINTLNAGFKKTDAALIANQEALEALKSSHQKQIDRLRADAEAASIFLRDALYELKSSHQMQLDMLKADATKTNGDIIRIRKDLEKQIQDDLKTKKDFSKSDSLTKAVSLERYTFSLITHGLKLNECAGRAVDLNPLIDQVKKLSTGILEFKKSQEEENETTISTKLNQLQSETKTCEERVRKVYRDFYQIFQDQAKIKIMENQSFGALQIQMKEQAENKFLEQYPGFFSRSWHLILGERRALYSAAKLEIFRKFVDDIVQQASIKRDFSNFFGSEEPVF